MNIVKLLLITLLTQFCFSGLIFAQTFLFPITVTDGINPSVELNLGMDCSGTDAYDPCLDQYAPPAPQPGAFDARIRSSDDFYTDVRGSTTDETTYEIRYQAGTGGTIVMTWDNSKIPGLGDFIITDRLGLGVFNIDMSTTDTFTPADGGAIAADGVWILVTATAQSTFPLFDLAVVNKNVGADGVYSFNASNCEETAIDINLSGVSTHNCIAVRSFSSPPENHGSFATNISQYRWEIENSGVNFTNAEVRFNTTQIPNAGIGNLSTITVYRRATPGSGAFTALSTSVNGNELVVNVTSFGEFALGSEDVDNPLPVELALFNVQLESNSVLLKWETESELNNLGFEVWRSDEEDDQYTLLSDYSKNPMLKGYGSTTIKHEYSYIDESVVNGQTYWYKIADVDFNGSRTFHGPKSVAIPFNSGNITNIGSNIPDNFKLYQNFPNPFNPNTTIQFDIPSGSGNLAGVRVIVFNNLGQMVNTIYQGKLTAGSYQVQWDGTNDSGNTVPSGIYYAFLNVNNSSQTLKMILLR